MADSNILDLTDFGFKEENIVEPVGEKFIIYSFPIDSTISLLFSYIEVLDTERNITQSFLRFLGVIGMETYTKTFNSTVDKYRNVLNYFNGIDTDDFYPNLHRIETIWHDFVDDLKRAKKQDKIGETDKWL